MIHAVLVDLDDTLFLQAAWLDGAWTATADASAPHGVDARALEAALRAIASEGTANGGIIDRALAEVGADAALAEELVAVFRSYRPQSLPLLPGALEALHRLRGRVALGLITDGDVDIQQGKIDALGLIGAFDAVVLSDEAGRAFRKPHPAPFRRALAMLGTDPALAVYVGDNPVKDVAGAMRVGLRAVRVRTGEYASAPNPVEPMMDVGDATEAFGALEALCPTLR